MPPCSAREIENQSAAYIGSESGFPVKTFKANKLEARPANSLTVPRLAALFCAVAICIQPVEIKLHTVYFPPICCCTDCTCGNVFPGIRFPIFPTQKCRMP